MAERMARVLRQPKMNAPTLAEAIRLAEEVSDE